MLSESFAITPARITNSRDVGQLMLRERENIARFRNLIWFQASFEFKGVQRICFNSVSGCKRNPIQARRVREFIANSLQSFLIFDWFSKRVFGSFSFLSFLESPLKTLVGERIERDSTTWLGVKRVGSRINRPRGLVHRYRLGLSWWCRSHQGLGCSSIKKPR